MGKRFLFFFFSSSRNILFYFIFAFILKQNLHFYKEMMAECPDNSYDGECLEAIFLCFV